MVCHGVYSRTVWLIVLCSLVSLYVYANLNKDSTTQNISSNDVKNVKSEIEGEKFEKVEDVPEKRTLVEKVEGIMEEDDDSSYRYTPTVAPATPENLLLSSVQLGGLIASSFSSTSISETTSKSTVKNDIMMNSISSAEDKVEINYSATKNVLETSVSTSASTENVLESASPIIHEPPKQSVIEMEVESPIQSIQYIQSDTATSGVASSTTVLPNDPVRSQQENKQNEKINDGEKQKSDRQNDDDKESKIVQENGASKNDVSLENSEGSSNNIKQNSESNVVIDPNKQIKIKTTIPTPIDHYPKQQDAVKNKGDEVKDVRSSDSVVVEDTSSTTTTTEETTTERITADEVKINTVAEATSTKSSSTAATSTKSTSTAATTSSTITIDQKTTQKTGTEDDDEEKPVDAKTKDMLSFTEWKIKKDLEKERKTNEEDEDSLIDTKQIIAIKNNNVTKLRKRIASKKNYASPNCGAKVIDSNEEASNSMAILKEDKDFYMLNPCNVKAWVVVELCERIQLHSIDFANFEMFSSTPEILELSVSNRYPAREWELVQLFNVKPEKEVQNFQIKEMFYAKYVKLEVKKYFGKEHYCPLSLLRVYGMTEVEEFESIADEHDSDTADTSKTVQSNHSPEEDGNKIGYFQSAKDAVVEIVNNVAKKLSGQKNLGDNDSATSLNAVHTKGNIVTLLSENEFENIEKSGFIMSCIEQTHYVSYNASLNPFCHFGLTYILKKRMCPTLATYHLFNNSCSSKKKRFVNLNKNKKLNKRNDLNANSEIVKPIPMPPVVIQKSPEKKAKDNDDTFEYTAAKQETQSQSHPSPREPFSEVIISKTQNVYTVVADSPTSTTDNSSHRVATTTASIANIKDRTCTTKSHPTLDVERLIQPTTSSPSETSNERSLVTETENNSNTVSVDKPVDSSASQSTLDVTTSTTISTIETKTASVTTTTTTTLPTAIYIESSNIVTGTTTANPTKRTNSEELVDVLEFKTNKDNDNVIVAEKAVEPSHPSSTSVPSEDSASHEIIKPSIESPELQATIRETPVLKEETTKEELTYGGLVSDIDSTQSSLASPKENLNTVQQLNSDIQPSASPVVVPSSVSQPIQNEQQEEINPSDSISTSSETLKQQAGEVQPQKQQNFKPAATERPKEGKADKENKLKEDNKHSEQQQQLNQQSTQQHEKQQKQHNKQSTEPTMSKDRTTPKSSQQHSTGGNGGAIPASKESIIVKLNAKVKALQSNLTMSMMYLEEMSEKYRTAVEKVDKRHERKTMQLNHTVQAQSALLKLQTEQIANLTGSLIKLIDKIEYMKKSSEEQQKLIADRHFVWVFIEFVFAIFFMVICRRRNPTPPPLTDNHLSEAHRRKSEPAISHSQLCASSNDKKRSHSTSEAPFHLHRKYEKTDERDDKRKKRKKLASSRSFEQFNLKESYEKGKQQTETKFSKTAGLLFYAGRGILSGITGALYNRSREKTGIKPSRSADALIDLDHHPKRHQKSMRRAQSIDLPTVVEEVDTIIDLQSTPVQNTENQQQERRPKSAESILYNNSKKHRKQKCLGRYI